MSTIQDRNYRAMLELASELPFGDAVKFVRSETGCNIIEARDICVYRVFREFPNSPLANHMLTIEAVRQLINH